MQIIFRKNLNADNPPLEAGKIYIQPISEPASGPRSMASQVLEKGLSCLRCGAEPIRYLVVDANPTLDDLLAAEFAARLLAGNDLPHGCAPFARYAALAREGLFASTVPPEESLEGIFLAVRNGHGNPLHDPEVGRLVTADWARVAEVVMTAAQDERDPFSSSLFAGPDFARERAFLANDKEIYQRDLASGQQWFVRLPSGPPRSGALLLTQPKSLLFKHWSRRQHPAHVAGTVTLLIVDWGRGHWVFSTDPTHRLSLRTLAEKLQAAEVAADPTAAQAHPWFDGKPYHHTLVASPYTGSQLSRQRVLGIVRQWAQATDPSRRRLGLKLAAAALILLACGVGVWRFRWPVPPVVDGPGVTMLQPAGAASTADRGLRRLEISPETLRGPAGQRSGTDYALLLACDNYTHWPPLGNAEKDAEEIDRILKGQYGFESHVLRSLDCNTMWNTLRTWAAKDYGPYDQLFIYVAGHGDYDSEARRGFIVGRDSHDDKSELDPAKRYKSQVALSDLKEMFERSNCRHLFMVLDVCYGGVIDLGAVDRGNPASRSSVEYVAKTQYIARKLVPVCRRFLTSCRNTITTDGLPGEHSPFARRLIASLLEDGERDGVVTSSKIFARVDVPGRPEQPMYGTLPKHELGGEFLFIRR